MPYVGRTDTRQSIDMCLHDVRIYIYIYIYIYDIYIYHIYIYIYIYICEHHVNTYLCSAAYPSDLHTACAFTKITYVNITFIYLSFIFHLSFIYLSSFHLSFMRKDNSRHLFDSLTLLTPCGFTPQYWLV